MRAAINSDGNFSIDLVELFRAYPQKDEDVAPERSEEHLNISRDTAKPFLIMTQRNCACATRSWRISCERCACCGGHGADQGEAADFRVRATSETGSSSGSASTRMRASCPQASHLASIERTPR